MDTKHDAETLIVANDKPRDSYGRRFYVVELTDGTSQQKGPFNSDGDREMHRSISLEIGRHNENKLTRR